MSARFHFHAGKGGVGKSTTSSLCAMHLARQGRDVLLVSLDPAHNQEDIFDTSFSETPRKMTENLHVAQADIDKWVEEYLRNVENQVKRTYTYQSAFNLEKHFGVIKHSPGIEEYALLLAFRHYSRLRPQADAVIFDMPPTALTVKFFNLPSLSLVWLEQLLALRMEILKRKEIITKIHVGKAEFECDKVTKKLEEQQAFYGELRDIFTDMQRCRVNVVVNPDRLSFAEAKRLEKTLDEMGVSLTDIIMNKVTPESSWDGAEPLFAHHGVRPMPLSASPLIGMDALQAYLDENESAFAFMG